VFYSAACHIFNSLFGVWKCGKTRSFVFHVKLLLLAAFGNRYTRSVDWWISIRSVDNTQDWRKFWKRFRGCFVFQSRVSTKTVVKCPCDKKMKVCLLNTWLAKFWAWLLAVCFECKFWISRSAITHVQNWPIGPRGVGSREKWRQRLTSLKFQRVNAANYLCKARV